MVAASLLTVGVTTSPKAQAANLYWDSDATAAGNNISTGANLGGTGSWDTVSTQWFNSTANSVWSNSALDVAYFMGPTPGTVTLAEVITVGGLVFSGTDYTLTGGTLTMAADVLAPYISITNGNVITIASAVAGTGGLTKMGDGLLRLTNGSNTFSGTTTIAGGSLLINAASQLGVSTSAVVVTAGNAVPSNVALVGFTGGSLILDGSLAGFEFSRPLNLEGRGPIGNNGAALLSIGNNSLSGLVTSSASSQSPATFRNTRITSVDGLLTMGGGLVVQGTAGTTFTTLGGVNQGGVSSYNLTGALNGTGTLQKVGSGVLVLAPSDTSGFSGRVRVSGSAANGQSSVRVTSAAVFGTANAGTTNATIDMDGGTLEAYTDTTIDFAKNVYGRAASAFFVSNALGGFGVNGSVAFGNFSYEDNATFTFASRNGFGASFTTAPVNGGDNNTTFTNNQAGTLAFAGNFWSNSDTAAARTFTIGGNGNTRIDGSVIASGGASFDHILTKSGSGLLTITGTATTLDGAVNSQGGAIAITDFRSLNNNTAAISLGNNTTTAGNLIIGTSVAANAAGLTTSKTITLNTTTVSPSIYANQTFASPVTLNGAITRTTQTTGGLIIGGTNANDNVINVAIANAGTGGVTKLGIGTWVLNAANTYSGATTIQAGTLKLRATAGASDVVGSASTNTIVFSADSATQTAGGVLEFRGFLNAATTETLGALTPTTGMGNVSAVSNGASATLTFTGMGTRGANTGLNFTLPSTGAINFTAAVTGNPNGIVGGFATVGGTNFVASIAANGAVSAPNYTAGGATFDSSIPATTGSATKNYFSNGSATTTGAFAANSLKLTNNGSGGAFTGNGVLTITAASATSLGGILFDNSGGAGSISGYTGITTSTTNQELIFFVGGSQAANALTVSSPLTNGTGSFTKNGPGLLVLEGNSTFTGNAVINEGTVRLAGATATLGVNSTAGNVTSLRQGAALDINAAGASQTIGIGALQGAGTITNSGGVGAAAGTVLLGQSGSTGTTVFTGILQNGAGALNVTIDGTTARTQALLGQSTYTGVTTIATGAQLTVNVLADGGVASGIGQSTSAAANLVFNGSAPTLIYQGNNLVGSLNLGSNSATTDRLFTIAGAAAVLSSTVSNNNAIVWRNTGTISLGAAAAKTLTLTGNSTGDNTLIPQLTDSGTGANITSLTKTGTGIWHLRAANNTYSGPTLLSQGILGATNGQGLSLNSNLQFDGGALYSQGTLTRDIGVGAGQMRFLAAAANTAQFSGGFVGGDAKLTVSWTGTPVWGSTAGFIDGRDGLILNGSQARAQGATTSNALSEVEIAGNFSLGTASGSGKSLSVTTTASSANVSVTVGDTSGLIVGQSLSGPGFASGAYIVSINSTTTFTMSANTAAAQTGVSGHAVEATTLRPIRVDDNGNTGADFATISGIISAGDASTGIRKVGSGMLRLTGANTYRGETNINQGVLAVRSLGSSTAPASTPTSVGLSGTDITFSNANAVTIGNGGTGGAILQYVGPGETADRKIRMNTTTGGVQLHADGTGAWVITNFANDMAAGAKTLNLRGTNAGANLITSQLSDNGGALSVTIDGGAAWVLTNSANNYTGLTLVSAGALGIGHNTAVGGAIQNNNGNIFAYGADRSVANILTLNNNAQWGFTGSYNLSFTSPVVLATSANSNNLYNSIAAGKTLTFASMTANALTANRNFGVDGPGESIIAGNITTSTAFGLQIIKTGEGTLTLGGDGAVSNWNQTGTGLDLDRGSLKFIANNVINTTAGYAGITVTPDLSDGDVATIELNGTTQTVNALTATTDGTVRIDNNSTSAASFRFGANNSTVTFGTGAGIYEINNTGSGKLDLVKLGNTAVSFGVSVPLRNKGVIASEGGGSFTVAGQVSAVSSLRAKENSTLALTGELTNPGLITSIEVSGGSTLSLLNGAGSAINLTSLSLGAGSGTAILNLNVGESATDTLTLLTGGTATLANTIRINMTDAGLDGGKTYTLLSLADGGLTAFGAGNIIQGGTPGGFTSMTWNVTDNAVTLTTGDLIVGSLYWRGGTNLAWNGNPNNWSEDKAGTVTPVSVPGAGTNVIFAWDGVGATALTTTLEQNFKINKLVFESGTTTPGAVTIAPGAVATNRLEIAPQVSTDGIEMKSAGPTTVTIGANLRIGTAQTWNVAAASGVLTLNGALLGGSNVTKTGAGKVTLAAAADPAFNSADTATFTVSGGTLELTHAGALGTAAAGNSATLVVTGSTFYLNNATAGTVSSPITLSGSTLSAGGANHTYSGAISVSTASVINMADSNGPFTNAARNITLSGALTGTAPLTIDSNNTDSGGNQLDGTLTVNHAAGSWTGNLAFNRGTMTIAAAASANVVPTNLTFNSYGRFILQGVDGRTINRTGTLTYAASAVGEIQVDNTTGTQVTDFVVNQNGAVTLGAGSAMRIALADQLARFNIAGAVTLAGNASISVSNAATRVLTISGVIGETGGARSLALNDDLGGWAATNGIISLTAANSYSGGTTLASGTLILGDKASLGTGTLTVSASSTLQASAVLTGANTVTNALAISGNLTFSGNNSLHLSGAADLGAAGRTLTANGAAGATLTLSGAISNLATADGNALTLAGNSTGTGVISGGFTMTGDAADATISGGSWTHSAGISRVADDLTLSTAASFSLTGGRLDVRDDFVVTGAGTVLNLNATGVLSFNTATLSGDASLLLRDGAQVNLGANNAVVATEFDRLFVGQDSDGLKTTLNMGTFSLTTSRLIVGERAATRIGDIVGTGTLTVTGGDIDLFKGVISANLGSTGSSALEKFGFDAMTLSGDNSALASTGSSVVYQGTLILDYSTNNATKLRALSSLDMRGGALTLLGNATAATSQAVGGLTLANGGSNRITLTPGSGQSVLLNVGAITRAAGQGTLRVNLPSGTQSATNGLLTTATVTNGTLPGYLTVSDGTAVSFAGKNADNALIAFASTTKTDLSTWSAADNVNNAGGGFSGTLAGLNSINTLTFASASNSSVTLAGGASLGIVSGGVLATSVVSSGTHAITGGRLSSGITDLVFTHEGAAVLNVGSNIGGVTAVTKAGTGTLRLTNAGNAFSGAVNVQAGVLQVAGGNAIGDFTSVILADDQASTFELQANETIGALSGGSSDTNSLAGLLALGTYGLTINVGGSDVIYAGVITGSGTITRGASSGTGNLLFRGVSGSGFTGSLVVNAGLMWLETGATMDASSLTVNRGGAFMISNNGTTRSGTRLPDSMPITLNSADGVWSGNNFPSGLAIRTDQNATTNEQVGLLTLGSGASYFYGTANVGTGTATAGVIVSDIVRSESSTLAVRGRNLGLAAGQRNFLRIVSGVTAETNFANALVGGAGAAGSKTISVVPWMIGETHDSGSTTSAHMGNSLVTYAVATGSGSGLRPLDLTTEYNTFATRAAAADNIRESRATALTGLAGTTINALVLNNSSTSAASVGFTGTGSGQTLIVTSGALLFTATGAVTGTPAMGLTLGGFDGGITVGASNEYVVFAQNPTSAAAGGTVTATISSPLTSTADITKSGRGVLVLSSVNTAGGGAKKTTINEGVLQIDALDKIGGDTGELVLAGGTLRFGGVFDPSTRTVRFLQGGATFDTNGNNVSLANSIGGGGAGGLTKSGNGILTLNAAANYSGPTNVGAGTLALGVSNAIGGGALTVSGGAVLDLATFNASVASFSLTNAANSVTGSGTLTVSGDAIVNRGSVSALLAGTMNLVKQTASQVVTLSNAGSSFTGYVHIQDGTLEVSSVANAGTASSLGASTGENSIIRIGNGTAAGTLLISATGAAGSTDRTISLDGTTGGGVIDNDGTAALILNGAVRGGEFGAKTLTLQGAALGFNNEVVSVISDGLATLSLTKAEAGTWVLRGANTYTGATTVSAGILQVGNGSTTGSLGTGAVSIASGATLALNRSDAVTVANVFSGLGTLSVSGGSTYTLTGANNLTGGVLFSGANITLGASQALGSLSGSSGNLALGSHVLTLSFAAGTSTYSGAISGTGSIIKTLAGTQVLAGANDFTGGVTVTGGLISVSDDAKLGAVAGPLVLNGGGLQVTGTTFTSWTNASPRTLTLSGAATFDIADQANAFTLGVNAITAAGTFTKAGAGRLEVTNALTMGAQQLRVDAGTLTLPQGFTNSTGGSFAVGSGANANAAFVQTGGTTVLGQADADTINVGNGGNAFGSVTIAGGSFQSSRLQPAGVTGTNNAGLVSVLNGGTLRLTTYFIGGRTNATNTGVVTIAGGSLDIASISGATGIGAFGGGRFEVNLGADLGGANKGGTFDAGTRTFNAVASVTTSQGIINLLGGTLTAGSVSSLAASTFAQFNLNGGILKAGAASATFLNASLTSATVHAGGGTIDNNGFAITLAEPLVAPAGSGVASIAVTGAAGYFTAPLVKLVGGGGNGDATAVAVLNGDGSISVVITNPGTNYTSAPTVTLVGGTTGTAATASATLNAGNIGGGVKFQGASTTTLSVANTYTGTTEVAAGTLAITGAGTLGSGAGLLLSGGTLDLGATSQTVGAVSITGASTISNGSLTGTSYAASLATGTATVSANLLANGSAGFSKTGNGVVVLSGANTYAGITSITGGTLAFSSADDLGNGSATNTITLDGGVLSFTPATTVSLAANQGVSVGASGGTIHVDEAFGALTLPGGVTSSSAVNLTKTGLGTLSVGATVNLNGGNVTVSSGVLNAGLAANGVGGIVLAEGATLNLYDGAATTTAISGLTLAGGSSLGFDLGATGVNDVLSLTGSVALASTVNLNFNALGAASAGTYDLLSVSTGTIEVAKYLLGLAPAGMNYNFSTVNSGQTLRLTTSLLSLVYWRGDVGGSWSSNNAGDTNWASDLAGTTDLGALPVATDTLVFGSSGATGPTFATTLDGSLTADSLKFTANPSGVTAVTISEGTGGTLTLSPASSNNGIAVAANAGAITIGVPVATGATQTWEVVGGGANGSSLAVSGVVAINHLINKTGAGTLTLSGSNTGAGGINFTAGTLVIGNDSALGTGAFSIGLGVTLDTGASAVVNAGNNVQNWNGDFTFTGTSTLNLGTGAVTLGENVTLTAGNNLTVGGAIGDGSATFGFTKAGAGVLTLNGANTYGGVTQITNGALNLSGDNSGAAGGVTMAAGTGLRLGHANALGSGTLTLNGGILNNISGATLALGGNVAQVWNAAFTFLGTNDLEMGAGAVTLGATTAVTVTAGSLTVNGVIDDGASTFGLNKAGAGTLSLGGLNTYGGATTLSQGALVYTADQMLTSSTNALNLGASAGSTDSFSFELNGASARFGGAMLVQTSNSVANTITIGAGESLRVDNAFTIGFNSAVNSTTRLNISGAGAFKVGDVGAPTNQGFQVGNGATTGISNSATLDMSGLATFYANLGSGTFRVGSPTNGGTGVSAAPSSVVLAASSTIIATTITTDTPDSTVVQSIKLGSVTNSLNATTITIGAAALGRSSGLLDFNGSSGSVTIRALDGVGRAVMNIGNSSSGTGASLVGTVDFSGHSADLLLSTLAVGGRSAAVSAAGTGTFSFDAGTLDATTLNIAARTGTTSTSGMVTGTVNLGGGTSTIGTVTMATNSSTVSTTGDATATLNISGGTNAITSLTMGVNTVSGATGNGSNTDATINISGGTTTVSTAFTMGAQNSASNAATNVNSALSTLNISAGSLILSGSTNLVMGATTLDANNAATASINITGTGSLTVGGNIQYTDGLGAETNTVTLNGGTLDMTSGNIGSAAATIAFNAQAGTLRNLAEFNGGGILTKSTTGTLLLDTANTFSGGLTIAANGGTVIAGHNNALGTGTVTLGGQAATLELANGITVANAMAVAASGNFKIIQLQSGATSATYSGNIINSEDVSVNFDLIAGVGGTLTVSGNISGNHALAGIEKLGVGTVILSGANSYTGTTTISAGTLSASAGSLAATSGITVNGATLTAVNYNAAATLALNASGTAALSGTGLNISGAVTNANTTADALNFTGTSDKIILASLAGAGATRFGSDADITGGISAGTVTVVGTLGASITGGTVSAGALSASSVTGGTNTITGTATITTVNGGTTSVAGVATITTVSSGTLNLTGATAGIGTLNGGTINLGTTALTVNDGTFGGLLAGATGSLLKATSGTLTLSGANTFGGGTTISAGTLTLGNAAALGTGAVTVASGATLNLNSLGVSNAITVASGGTVEGGPTTASVTTSGPSAVINTVLTGGGGLTKADGGELTLTTPNFFTGAVTANTAGAVIKAAFLSDTSSSLGASTLTNPANLLLGSGATLEFTGTSSAVTSRSFTIGGSAGISATGTGTLEFTSASQIATTGTAPALTLSANNSGTNRFAASLAEGNTALATLAINGTGVWVIGTGANRFKNDIRIEAATGATIGLENASLPSGATLAVANNATVRWESGNTTGVKLEVAAGTTAKLDLGANNVVFSTAPVVTGTGSTTLEKQGSGTLRIAEGVSAPTVNVTLPANSGLLAVNGTIGSVTLASGSKLGGSGAVASATLVSGAILSPGNSPGMFTVGDLALPGGSYYDWQVQDATNHDTGYDKLTVTGNLDLTGASPTNRVILRIASLLGNGDGTALGNPLNFGPPGGASSIRTFQFGQVGGVLLNSGQNISDVFEINVSGFTYTDGSSSNAALWSIAWNQGSGAITLTAVPEPSTYGFGLGALALAAAAIRRRKRQAKA